MVEFSCEAIWSWAFVCWKISDYSFDFPCLWWVCSDLLFLPGSVLESYTFLRICPFLASCPFYWHRAAGSSLLWSFVFLCCLLWFLQFHFQSCWFDSNWSINSHHTRTCHFPDKLEEDQASWPTLFNIRECSTQGFPTYWLMNGYSW